MLLPLVPALTDDAGGNGGDMAWLAPVRFTAVCKQ